MTRKTSFLEFWRSRKERAACLQRAKRLRLLPSQLKQLRDDGAVRAALKNCRIASLLPPVGNEFLRPFTSASLEQISQVKKEKEQRGKKKEQKVKSDVLPKPSPDLEEEKPLPFIFGEPSQAHLNTPLEELDPYHQSETFLVLGKGKVIHRFNAHKACYLFSPVNPLRTLAIKILTNSLFSSLIFVTLLVNFIFMVGLTGFSIVNRNVELAFTAIYLLEALVKMVSRGLCVGKFTYLRNPWNWPDVAIIAAAFLLLCVHFPALKTVALIWKMLPIFPGLKKTVSSFVHSMKRLCCVLALTFVLLCVFATISLQLYMGSLRQKCISLHNLTSDSSFSHYYDDHNSSFNYREHIQNRNNSYFRPGEKDALVCGNASDAGRCPEGFTCLKEPTNPNYGYTSYASFGWSLLSTFRLLTQDRWDNLMQLVLRANGRFSFVYFMFVSSPGCFVLVSLIIAVTAAALCELERSRWGEASRKEKEYNQILKALKRSEEEEVGKSEGHDNGKKSPESQPSSEGGVGPQGSCPPCCHAAAELLLTWNCCGCWRGLKRWLHAIVTHPGFDLGIVVCLIINIIFIAMEHYPLTMQFYYILSTAEMVFTFIFIAEMLVKIVAMDPYNYFKVCWNIYEAIIVAISVLELMLADVTGLAVLLRCYRLARWWHCFHVSLKVTLKYSVLLLLVFFGFVTVGFQLFHRQYDDFVCKISEDCMLPRWHMSSFFHTFLSIFRILCGSWIEILWDCMEVSGMAMCLTFILSVVIMGNLLILHLFLILLLNPYSSDLVEERKENNVEIAAGWCKTWVLENICPSLGKKDSNKSDRTAANGQRKNKDYVALDLVMSHETKVKTPDEERPKHATEQEESEVRRDQADGDQKEEGPESCCCQSCYRCCPCLNVDTSQGAGRCCFNFRKGCLNIVQSKFFKLFINFIVVLSSMFLVFEDIYWHQREIVMVVVGISSMVFLLLFFIEMILKWIGFGFRKYFTDTWCWLEFLIINVFILVFITGSFGTLRVLIVVRILSFFQGPRLVVQTLFRMIPSMIQGLLVLLQLWLVFSIAGVHLFAGKFYYCSNETSMEIFHAEHVNNKSDCLFLIEADYDEVRWKNAVFNFNNVMMGYLSLYILGFSKGWFDIMYSAVDSRLVEDQPVYENNLYMWIYFVLFIINVFFSINFFIKVILTDLQAKFRDKPELMTKHQQKHSRALMKLFPKSPQRAVPPPQNKCLAGLFRLMNSSWYELVMVVLICLNVVVLLVESWDDSIEKYNVLNIMQFVFILIFLVEFIFKVIAFRQHYFKDAWNIIDFVVLLIQITGVFIFDIMWIYFFHPCMFVFLRLFRICRVLHVIPVTRRIRRVLLAFVKSVPALLNIAFVLLIVMVIFSLIGMFNFAYVKKGAAINDLFNFETFCNSMVCMFMTSTTADWAGLLQPIMSYPPDCDPLAEHPGTYVVGDCSNPTLGIVFFTTYISLSSLILVLLYITVIMEIINSEDTEALCDNDLQNFCKTWMKFDPEGTHLIPYSKLSEFSDSLQDPLRVPKPNATKLVRMDLPLYPGDKVHSTDVLLSLAKQVLDDAEEVNSLKERMEKQFKAKQVLDEPISSTLRRRQEDMAAKVIQRAFRKGRATLEKEKPVAELSDSSPPEGASE